MSSSFLVSAILAAAFAAVTAPAVAGSIEIGPTRLQMIGPERTATLTIRNVDTSPTNVQVRTVDWSQPNGADSYTPSTMLIVSPPIVTLGAGDTQVIRVVIENLPAGKSEAAFRLILDEIPVQHAGDGAGVQTALRALVPVFVTPSTQSRPSLRWTAARDGADLILTAQNDGDTRDRLLNVKVSAGGRAIGNAPLEGYVLSRSSRTWRLPGATAVTSVTVEGEGDFGEVRADVPIRP